MGKNIRWTLEPSLSLKTRRDADFEEILFSSPHRMCTPRCAGRVQTLRREVGIWHLPGGFSTLSKARSPQHQAYLLQSSEKRFSKMSKSRGAVFLTSFIMSQISCHLKGREWNGNEVGGNEMALPSCGPEQTCWRGSRNLSHPHPSISEVAILALNLPQDSKSCSKWKSNTIFLTSITE